MIQSITHTHTWPHTYTHTLKDTHTHTHTEQKICYLWYRRRVYFVCFSFNHPCLKTCGTQCQFDICPLLSWWYLITALLSKTRSHLYYVDVRPKCYVLLCWWENSNSCLFFSLLLILMCTCVEIQNFCLIGYNLMWLCVFSFFPHSPTSLPEL